MTAADDKYTVLQDGWGRWQLGFHALFTLAANCPNLKELTISEEHLEVSMATLFASILPAALEELCDYTLVWEALLFVKIAS